MVKEMSFNHKAINLDLPKVTSIVTHTLNRMKLIPRKIKTEL